MDDITLSDNQTMIKIQAMLIYQEESMMKRAGSEGDAGINHTDKYPECNYLVKNDFRIFYRVYKYSQTFQLYPYIVHDMYLNI